MSSGILEFIKKIKTLKKLRLKKLFKKQHKKSFYSIPTQNSAMKRYKT
jgi:hypothetical protein